MLCHRSLCLTLAACVYSSVALTRNLDYFRMCFEKPKCCLKAFDVVYLPLEPENVVKPCVERHDRVAKLVGIEFFQDGDEVAPMVLGIPYIVPATGVLMATGGNYAGFLMPRFDGTLKHVDPEGETFSNKTMKKREAAMIALGYFGLHKAGFLHRDVQGGNVATHSSGIVALNDFGELREWPYKDSGKREDSMGDDAHVDPERTALAWYGPESDWYGFGKMLLFTHAKAEVVIRAWEMPNMRAWLSTHARDKIKKALAAHDTDALLVDLILLLICGTDAGEHIYLNGSSPEVVKAAAAKYATIETHPVLQHKYWSTGPDAVDWHALLKEWPAFPSGLCTEDFYSADKCPPETLNSTALENKSEQALEM